MPLIVNSNPKVERIFEKFPEKVRFQMLKLRNLILETAQNIENVDTLEETLKWGEISYIAPQGSTIRMDWKEKNPDCYKLFFNCNSRLISTFKIVFQSALEYEGNRALVFYFTKPLPKFAVSQCIKTAFLYHHVKNQPTLGL